MKMPPLLSYLTLMFSILFFSCSSNEDEIPNEVPRVLSLKIIVEDLDIDIGESTKFTVLSDKGNDLTTISKILVNGVAITGNIFKPTEIGTYTVKAVYQNITSSEVTLKVEVLGPRFQKNVVVEDYTGAWCGWCPRVAYAIEQIKSKTNYSIPIAIHYKDIMENSLGKRIMSAFSIDGFPTAYIDRNSKWAYPETSNLNQVIGLTKKKSIIGLSLESSLSKSNLTVKVKVQFGKTIDKSLKLVILVLEDGIKETQSNYTSYYGGESEINDFVHNHVLRGALTNVLGDVIPSSKIVKSNIYSKDFLVTVPSLVSNPSKMSFVAMVVDSDKIVINAMHSYVNKVKKFEIK